jgi:hypothetical protein
MFRLFGDREFVASRAKAAAVDAVLISHEVTPEQVDLVVRQAFPIADLPLVARGFLTGRDPLAERSETWVADGAGYRGTFAVHVEGAPGELTGTVTSVPHEEGTEVTVDLEAVVPVPALGGALETTLIEKVSSVLATEHAYFVEYLAR